MLLAQVCTHPGLGTSLSDQQMNRLQLMVLVAVGDVAAQYATLAVAPQPPE